MMNNSTILISEKIKIYRQKNELSQTDFGKLMGVTPQAVSKWEHCDCYPDITLLPHLATIIGCQVNDFFKY